MGALSTQKMAFAVRLRMASTNLLESVNDMRGLKAEWSAAGYLDGLEDSDMINENAGITNGQLSAVVGTTLQAIEVLLAAGHSTNLHKLLYKGKNG